MRTLSRDTVGILLMLGVLALILATLEWVGDRMRPPTSLEAPAKTIKTVAIPRAIERAPLPQPCARLPVCDARSDRKHWIYAVAHLVRDEGSQRADWPMSLLGQSWIQFEAVTPVTHQLSRGMLRTS